MRKTSQTGIDLIKSFEGFSPVAFRLKVGTDSSGNPIYDSKNCTYGYGHCGSEVTEGQSITRQQAEELLKQDLKYFEDCVNNSDYCPVTDELNQNQFDALVSFTYNCGPGGLQYLCKNKGLKEIGYALPKTYVTSNGVYLQGLYNRRLKEQELFFGADGAVPTEENDNIKSVQIWLNNFYEAGLAVDGIYGKNTKAALVKALQDSFNHYYGAGLAVDGIFGSKTKSAVRNLYKGHSGSCTRTLQGLLICNGYDIAFDGVYGSETEQAVKDFQSSHGLTADGIAGRNTFEMLCRG